MNRREMLIGASAAAAAGLVVSGHPVVGGDHEVSHDATHRNPTHRECLKACTECRTACNETAGHCLGLLKSGNSEHAAAVELTLACEEFCGLSAKLIAQGNLLMFPACDACATACDACATECERISSDEQMAMCGKACRLCATTCRKMMHH